jgi:hypothetical protein
MYVASVHAGTVQQAPQAAGDSQNPANPKDKEQSGPQLLDQLTTDLLKVVKNHPIWAIVIGMAFLALIIGLVILVYYASRISTDVSYPKQKEPLFFFWLGMVYTSLLLLAAVAYNILVGRNDVLLLGGILPIAVPWFGAVGAVTISLEGVFLWNNQWDTKYNYWHIGRPLFGAVLGIVAYFIFVVIVTASGSPPKFLDAGGTAGTTPKDLIIFYVLAFLVGYREETFRELIKRVTDLILRPGSQTASEPSATFKVDGKQVNEIKMPATAINKPSSVTVEVQNTGGVSLMTPDISVSTDSPGNAGTFVKDGGHDSVSGKDLTPGEMRTVMVTFTPQVAGSFTGVLTLKASNLSTPRTIRITGTAQ